MQITSGDTFALTQPGHPLDASLHARLIPRAAGGVVIDLTATVIDGQHVFQAAPDVTATWAAGTYALVIWRTSSAQTTTISTSTVEILLDPRTAMAGLDTRTPARRALDDAITARHQFDPTLRRYQIGGREMEFQSIADLDRKIASLRDEVHLEDVAAGRTKPARRFIRTRI
jgi:hypothetical protein